MIVFFKQYRVEELSVLERLLIVGASVALSHLSWKCVEQPCRHKAAGASLAFRPLAIGTGSLWICLLLVAWRIVRTSGNETASRAPAFFNVTGGLEAMTAYDATPSLSKGGILINASVETPRCVVVGSSHAMMLGTVIESLSKTYGVPCAFLSHPGSAGSALFVSNHGEARVSQKMSELLKQDEEIKEYIALWKPDLVVLAGKWDSEMRGESKANETWPTFAEAFSNTVSWLAGHSSKVVVVAEVPGLPSRFQPELENSIWRLFRAGGDVMPRLREPATETAARRKALELFKASKDSRISVEDPESVFTNPDHTLRYYDTNGLFYFDDNHLSALGAMQCSPLFEPYFKALQDKGPERFSGHNDAQGLRQDR